MKKHLALLLLIVVCEVPAGISSYSCIVKGEYDVGMGGQLVAASKVYLGQEFIVERSSGLVRGEVIQNSTYPTKAVIDAGSEDQAYKLIWISKEVMATSGGRNAGYLAIEEYEVGKQKPFLLVTGSRVVSGYCE